MNAMANTLSVRLSTIAITRLESLAKRFEMSKGEALSWVLVETAPPVVPKRGKETRSVSVSMYLSDPAQAVLSRVVTQHGSSESIVIEAYLGREYR
jgi:hypothetical protein